MNAESPLASLINSSEEFDVVLPGFDATIREWFRNYKTTDGKPKNEFAYEEKILHKEEAERIIEETHERWNILVDGGVKPDDLWIECRE